MNRVLNVVFRPEPEGGFTAIVPSLPGCVTFGKNLKEAQRMLLEAVEIYVESLAKHGEAIPADAPAFLSSVRIESKGKRMKAYAA
jgi:predicted RNase H-like HicB family nuclease